MITSLATRPFGGTNVLSRVDLFVYSARTTDNESDEA